MTDSNEVVKTFPEEQATAEAVKEIKVSNPTTEEMSAIVSSIKANYNFDVDVKPANFTFRKTKDKDTGIETVRHPVQLAIPYPSVQGVIKILETGGKQLELLMEAVETVINDAARDLLYEDTSLNAATFPVEKLSWEYIANLPKAQRKGGGILKEVWEGFVQDYVEVMPAAADKTIAQVTAAAKLLQNKLVQVKTNKPVLELLVEQLTIYMSASENASDYAECVEFLVNKADTLLNMSEKDLLANL